MVQPGGTEGQGGRDPVAPRVGRTDVGGRDRPGPARSPRLDDRPLRLFTLNFWRQGIYRKRGRRLSALRSLVHCPIRGYQMPGEPLGIEQRRREAVFRELVLCLGKQSGIGRELERESLIFFQLTGDEFGHLVRAEQGGG